MGTHKTRIRRTVTLCTHSPKGKWQGGPIRLWAFGYADLADLLGLKEATVRRLVGDEKFDPSDLGSICKAWDDRNTPCRGEKKP